VEWLRVLAKMARGSGKRSRLHRGFSKVISGMVSKATHGNINRELNGKIIATETILASRL
jgi:hypothetical protein